jgi:hypothetical protein
MALSAISLEFPVKCLSRKLDRAEKAFLRLRATRNAVIIGYIEGVRHYFCGRGTRQAELSALPLRRLVHRHRASRCTAMCNLHLRFSYRSGERMFNERG